MATPDRTAQQRWADALAAWAIPDEIMQAAPQSPWGFPRQIFSHIDPTPPDTPSSRRALEVLAEPILGVILDVGAGGGRASLPLCPPGLAVVAVDSSPELLEAFAAEADRRGIEHRVLHGPWPDIAEATPVTDLVVCHHVVYNVPAIGPFVTALTDHARRRVVVELSGVHPQTALNDLWLRFHGLERPTGPGVDEFVAVLRELGIRPTVEEFSRAPFNHRQSREDLVAMTRRRLCLTPDRDAEVDEALGEEPHVFIDEAACVWWEGGAG